MFGKNISESMLTLFTNVSQILMIANNPNCSSMMRPTPGTLVVRFNHCENTSVPLYRNKVDILALNGQYHDLYENPCVQKVGLPKLVLTSSYNFNNHNTSTYHLGSECHHMLKLSKAGLCTTGFQTFLYMRRFFAVPIILHGFSGRGAEHPRHAYQQEYSAYHRFGNVSNIC